MLETFSEVNFFMARYFLKFVGFSEEGICKGVKAQICAVNKNLLSVDKVVQNGGTVVYSPGGSFIEYPFTGERMWLQNQQDHPIHTI